MVRKTKYTPDRLRKIEEALVRTGKDEAAIAAARIHQSTCWAWLSEKTEFSELVSRAKERLV